MLPAYTASQVEAAVRRAVELLRAGEVVALPTETVYGLAANALDARAVAKIYEAKGRPSHNPIIVHVAGVAMARRCVSSWPPTAQRLSAAFWPGPLTLVLPRSGEIPDVVTAGGGTVGVRWPKHPFMQAVIEACGFPLAAPSANPSNMISPTRAEHVCKGLAGRVALIVDGGPSQVGIESTVLDLTGGAPRVLRPGTIHGESLLAVLGQSESPEAEVLRPAGGPLRSPGLLPRHYAPKAKLLVWAWQNEQDLREQIRWQNEQDLREQIRRVQAVAGQCHIIAHSHIPSAAGLGGVSMIPHDAAAFARAIYAELHRCDEAEAAWIIVEAPPAGAEWRGIADRLRRASVG
ncbi:MAG: L-threonylcarbamoyladenylate synthase [Verrucomicrobia bacterium]|nr:L-threonylcarbamoyladenylate synthase [Verrucomicrobiota bacterium]